VNTLLTIVDGEAKPLAPPDFDFTGTISLTIIATVGDDGTITELRCTSMETSWDAKLKRVS